MKFQPVLKNMLLLIAVLALFAAGMGLFDTAPGKPYNFTSQRGETVLINGHGL